jgi:hypothetical protein
LKTVFFGLYYPLKIASLSNDTSLSYLWNPRNLAIDCDKHHGGHLRLN